MEPLRQASVVRFGTYEIALHSGELRKAGVRIRVQQQPLRLLEILLEHPGEVVIREELRSRIWPNENFGDFDQAVNVAIAKLRGALGDSADNPRYIETLPRRGYRFIADVAVVNRPIDKMEFVHAGASSGKEDRAPLEVELHFVDRKSTRLNSSHPSISYAVFCLKKKNRAAKYLHLRLSLEHQRT